MNQQRRVQFNENVQPTSHFVFGYCRDLIQRIGSLKPKTWTLLIVIVYMIGSFILLVWGLVGLNIAHKKTFHHLDKNRKCSVCEAQTLLRQAHPAPWMLIVVSLIFFALGAILLVGRNKEKPYLLTIWLGALLISLVGSIMFLVFFLILFAFFEPEATCFVGLFFASLSLSIPILCFRIVFIFQREMIQARDIPLVELCKPDLRNND